MEFFKEKNGKFVAASISTSARAAGPIRIVMTLIPLGIIAYVFFFSPAGEVGSEERIPLMIGAGAVVFSTLITFALRKAGLGSSMIVDQMTGMVSFRSPGGNRRGVSISDLDRIVINTMPRQNRVAVLSRSGLATPTTSSPAILCFVRNDGNREVIMYSSDKTRLRMYADELSTLTSLSVSEEMTGKG